MQLLSRIAAIAILCSSLTITAMEKAALKTEASILIHRVLGKSQLIEACLKEDLNEVIKLLSSQAIDINAIDAHGNTALILACEKGNSAITAALLQHKLIKTNIQNFQGKTALMLACTQGQKKIVGLLLAKHPDLDLEDLERKTAYMLVQEKTIASPENKNWQKIREMLRSASLMNILLNPTVLILSAAAITSLITHSSRYFNQRSFAYTDPVYHLFYFNSLTDIQRNEHESLLLHTSNPVSLVHNSPFMKKLSLDQKIDLLHVIRRYYHRMNLQRNPLQTSLSFSKLPAFKKAQQQALDAFELPAKELEKNIRAAFALEQRNLFSNTLDSRESPVKTTHIFALPEDITAQCSSLRYKKCAAALKRKIILFWDLDTGACIGIVRIPTDKILHLIFDQNATQIAAISKLSEFFIISVETQEISAHWIQPNSSTITSVCFNKTGNRLAAGTTHGDLIVWDVQGGKDSSVQKTPGNPPITHVCFKNDTVLMVSAQGAILHLELPQLQLEPLTAEKSNAITALLSDDKIAYVVDGEALQIYNEIYKKPRTLHLNSKATAACIHSSGSHFAHLTSQSVVVWEVVAGRLICNFKLAVPHPISIEYGPTPHDILVISREESKRLITIFQIQLPPVLIPQKPEWLKTFEKWGAQICKRLAADYNEIWAPFLSYDTVNLYDLLENNDFITLFPQLDTPEKTDFQKIVVMFSQEEHYRKPLTLIIDKDQKDTDSGRSLLELALDSPDNLYRMQLSDDQNQKIATIVKQLEQDYQALSAFSNKNQLSEDI